ncbi:MAG: hypothetical protein IKS17_02300 [Firmicutes bacterium]|nr:hypothetical protein [Bacillota bacterium]
MRCFYHKDKDSTTVCSVCGKALCRACASYWGSVICSGCVKKLAAQRRNKQLFVFFAAVAVTLLLFWLIYFKAGRHDLSYLVNALFGIGAREKRDVLFKWALACIPAGIYAFRIPAAAAAQKYDLAGAGITACFVLMLVLGTVLGWAALPVLLIWLIYNFVKYNVTVKKAKKRIKKMIKETEK